MNAIASADENNETQTGNTSPAEAPIVADLSKDKTDLLAELACCYRVLEAITNAIANGDSDLSTVNWQYVHASERDALKLLKKLNPNFVP